MPSRKNELGPQSRISRNILTFIIFLQLAIGSFVWLESRSLRQLDSQLLNQHVSLINLHERLNQLQSDIRSVDAATEARLSGPKIISQQDSAKQLSNSLSMFTQVKGVVPPENLSEILAHAATFDQIAAGAGDVEFFKNALSQTQIGIQHWESAANQLETEYQGQSQKARQDRALVEFAVTASPIFLLVALLCMHLLKRDALRQELDREQMESELRRERATLEKRIDSRTSELQAEVAVRQRAEQLNSGRNQLLEMLAREEPARDIFRTMVDVIAKDRSRWCCALHLLKRGKLHMEASSGLPVSLMRNLQQLDVDMTYAPEAVALKERKTQILEDLTQDLKPWTSLLHSSKIQSLWSTPIFAPDGTALGTLTIYSLLRCMPSQADLSLLESHSQMASMILERYRLQEDLRRHAYHDSLTGLPNRLLGEEHLAAAIRRGQRAASAVAILWIDLDKFKQTNDVHGHLAGDAVLKEVAARLSRRFRDSDTIARMGGDEFMAVLEGIDGRSTAQEIAEHVVSELAVPIPFQGLMLNTAASIGVSVFPDDGDTADILQRNADMAMYEAKFGQHGARVFSPAMNSMLSERREVEKSMIRALDEGGFALHYQPQYERYGQLAGFEALLRFPHPIMGMMAPSRLISIAEESQMIVALGNWVLRQACNQSRLWQEAGHRPIPIAVNISSMQFVRRDFAEQVSQALEETGLRPELLELELTESVMIKDFVESTRQLERLKLLGVGIALDDFGTGYSSLNQLHRLPIDSLKIDHSFTQGISHPDGTLPIVESVITMAHRMGMRVVAEGVETLEQMVTLRQKGCDIMQGYLFSAPVDANGAAVLLAAGNNPLLSIGNSGAIKSRGLTSGIGVPLRA